MIKRRKRGIKRGLWQRLCGSEEYANKTVKDSIENPLILSNFRNKFLSLSVSSFPPKWLSASLSFETSGCTINSSQLFNKDLWKQKYLFLLFLVLLYVLFEISVPNYLKLRYLLLVFFCFSDCLVNKKIHLMYNFLKYSRLCLVYKDCLHWPSDQFV